MSDTVLSHYPSSQPFRFKLEGLLGDPPNYLSLSELRDLPAPHMWSRIRSVSGERILITLEDQDGRAALPFLKLLAAVSQARRIEIIDAELQQNGTSRWSLVADVASIVTTSSRGLLAAARARRAAT